MTKSDSELHKRLQQAAAQLREAVNDFQIEPPVTHVYNPLDYAWAIHCQYLRLAKSSCRILLLGMNPGPWGMAQTGVPFGEVHAVRDWLELGGDVKQPGHEHPKRPISGLDCTRSEVSGQRLWGLMREEFGAREAFFDDHFVVNYCPLVFMESTGRNHTPDKLTRQKRDQLAEICDRHLKSVIDCFDQLEHVVGIGTYAANCFQRIELSSDIKQTRILHPSPASPAANRDWPGTVRAQLREAQVWSCHSS